MADYAISNVPRRVVYAASGTGPYAFTFEILSQTDIAVYKASTLLTLTTDYTVSISSNGTGSVTLVASAGTSNITIVGAKNIQRTTDFTTGGDLFANTLNDELDNQTIFIQQVAETAERGLKAPVTDPTDIAMTLPAKASRAGKTLAFDSNGNPVVGEDIGNWRGNWTSGTSYTVRDLVKDASNSSVYRCNSAHTASGTTPISSNTDSAKWDLVIDGTAVADAEAAQAAAEAAQAAAETAETNAETAATAAASSASAASTSASNASTSASGASTSASAASTSASAASTSATNAASSASTASTAATNASNSASAASTSASNASSSASAASTSASNASTSATNAASSATAASGSASTASTQATNAASSATASAGSATDSATSATASAASAVSAASSAASAAALLDNFDDRYLGAKTADPSVDNDGNALAVGALYFNTTDGVMKVYTASGWIAASSASVATLATYEFVATSGQTVFTGADANGATLSYVAPALIITLNGVRLRPGDDYTATNGTSITLASGATLNDELVVDAFGSFLVANTYTIAEVDAFAVKLTGNQSIAGNKNFASNTLYVDDTNDRVGVGTASPSNKLYVSTNSTTTTAKGLSIANTAVSTGSGQVEVDFYTDQYDGSTLTNKARITASLQSDSTNGYLAFSTLNSTMQERMRLDASGNLKFDSGYGSVATAYGCRAWVRFNGQGTVAINGSGNVSSITDNGVGTYTVNFINSMPDANYCPQYSDYSWGNGYPDTLQTGSYKVTSLTSSFNASDVAMIFTCVFR